MEKMEKIGFSVAIIGHAALLGGFYLGLLSDDEPKPQEASISVNIVADIADISTAPDAIQEEPAPAAEAPEEPEEVEEVEAPLPTLVEEKPSPIAKKTPPKKKPKDKPKSKPKKPSKKKTESKKKKTETKKKKSKGFSKDFTSSFDGKGKAKGTPASKTAAEVKRSIKVSLSSQVERFFKRCIPSGVDINKITTSATLNLNQNGGLSSITGLNQRGINSNNKAQAPLLKECVSKSIKAAAPFKNLPKENYAVWKKWPMEFKKK